MPPPPPPPPPPPQQPPQPPRRPAFKHKDSDADIVYDPAGGGVRGEQSPLIPQNTGRGGSGPAAVLYRHFSMDVRSPYATIGQHKTATTASTAGASGGGGPQHYPHPVTIKRSSWTRIVALLGCLLALIASYWIGYENGISTSSSRSVDQRKIRTIDQAVEYTLTVDVKPATNISSIGGGGSNSDSNNNSHGLQRRQPLKVWYRTWGNPVDGVPVLFVHGGPGNAIEDYHNENHKFFDYRQFFVVEVDQRGTGKSHPSVRDDWRNMGYYRDVSIDLMANDFELVRRELGIDRWLVWGGSFGSTLAINYGARFPESCLALILRGIYLDTAEEVDTIYSRSTYENNPKRLREFNILYEYAAKHIPKHEEPLDPNDAHRIMLTYEDMITNGDKYAMWHWHVFENNLMEELPENLLDPDSITEKSFPEATSIAFFETRLWLHGSYEQPTSDLMTRMDPLTTIPGGVYVCQGWRDEVCPPKYAQKFVDGLQRAYDERRTKRADSSAADGLPTKVHSRFVDSGHEQSDPVMGKCLQETLQEYIAAYKKSNHNNKKGTTQTSSSNGDGNEDKSFNRNRNGSY